MQQNFENHSQEMFGREPDIKFLVERAQKPGLTAVTARPLMGKTWTLTETARRLSESGDYIVGYHESKGAEGSHLLYVVSDLYARWLEDSNMMEQAKSQWSRHKKNLLPKLGQTLGELFEITSKSSGSNIDAGHLVRKAFDKFSEMNKDLVTGGVKLPPLDYDQARQLTNLVRQISGKRIVLILDAWEKSLSLEYEHQTLEAFISHLEDWLDVHIFLGIRQPSLNNPQSEDEAFKKAKDLSNKKISAKIYELPLMHIKNEPYVNRLMIDYIKQHIPAAKQIDENKLLEMINGYPGVLSRWLEASSQIKSENLSKLAKDAQQYRYREFEVLLENLSSDEKVFAARIAFFPRLNSGLWGKFSRILLSEMDKAVLYSLINKGILENKTYPVYGHDTRHVAAKNWFANNLVGLIKDEGQYIIWRIVAEVSNKIRNENVSPSIGLYISALMACRNLVDELQMDKLSVFLIKCALVFGGFHEQSMLAEFKSQWKLALQKDKSIVPFLTDTYLYLISDQIRQDDKEDLIKECTEIIQMPGAPANHIAIALSYRGKIRVDKGDREGTIKDCNEIIGMSDVSPDIVALALKNRSASKHRQGDIEGALQDCSAVIEMPEAPPETIALALGQRASIKSEKGDEEGSIEDLTAIIDRPGVPVNLIAFALRNRGATKKKLGKNEEAMMDFIAIIEMNDASPEVLANAYKSLGSIKTENNDITGAIEDYTAIIGIPDAHMEQKAEALFYRGSLKAKNGDKKGAVDDLKTVIEMPETTNELVARALSERGLLKIQSGDKKGAIEDYSAIIGMSNIPSYCIESALGCRGFLKSDQGDNKGAMEDYTAITEMSDVPNELVAQALMERGILKDEVGDKEGAMDDFDTVIKISDALPDSIARTLTMRGFLKAEAGDKEGALKDCTAVFKISGVSSYVLDLSKKFHKSLQNGKI